MTPGEILEFDRHVVGVLAFAGLAMAILTVACGISWRMPAFTIWGVLMCVLAGFNILSVTGYW